jgi:hypothetical protein
MTNTSSTITSTSVSLAETFTRLVSHTTTITNTITPHSASPTDIISAKERIIIGISVEVPLTCENYDKYSDYYGISDPKSNPDIAGIGVCMPVWHR